MSVTDQIDSPMKRSSRWEMGLNSIRQQINSFWKRFSETYARILLGYSWIILCSSFLLTLALTGCLVLFMNVRPFDQNDFLMAHSESMRNAQRLREIFGNDSELRAHQQLQLYPGLDIIIKKFLITNLSESVDINMLNEQIIDEIHRLNEIIQSISYRNGDDSRQYNYSTLCNKMNNACMIDGNYILTDKFRQTLSNLQLPKHGYFLGNDGASGIPEFMFGKDFRLTNVSPIVVDDYEEVESNTNEDDQIELLNSTSTVVDKSELKIISHVSLFRLRYSLNSSTPEMNQLAIGWEREAFRYLNEEYQSDRIELSISTSTAITDTILKKAHEEGVFMIIVIVVFFLLASISVTIQGNRLTSVGLLPLCGIVSLILSTGATFGLLSICSINIIEPMTFLVFIVAIVDCMRCSMVCGEYHRIIENYFNKTSNTQVEIPIDDILRSIIRTTQPYFIISTMVISISYSIFAALSPMSSSVSIGSALAIYIVINYFVHLTFFFSTLVINLRRISSRRHCLSCLRLSSKYNPKKVSNPTRFQRYYNEYHSVFKIDYIYKTLIAPILCLLSFGCIMFSIWFALSIDTRLFVDELLPRDAFSLRSHMKSQIEDFHIGPVIFFTIPKPVDYEDKKVMSAMNSILEQCRDEPRTNAFKLLWLEHENVNVITNNNDQIPLTFRMTPFSHNDLLVENEGNYSKIIASRFYCQYKSILGDREDIRTMNNIYANAKRSSLPSIFPYSLVFPNYESLTQIRIEIYLLLFLLVLSGFLLTYSFLHFKISLTIVFYFLMICMCTLACLHQFQNFHFNFANALWLSVIPMVFIEALIHSSFFSTKSRWQYNRIIISLMISLLIIYVYPLQTYVFLLIRNSLMYQSLFCFLVINIFVPAYHSLVLNRRYTEITSLPMQSMAALSDGNQSLTNELDTKTFILESIKITSNCSK